MPYRNELQRTQALQTMEGRSRVVTPRGINTLTSPLTPRSPAGVSLCLKLTGGQWETTLTSGGSELGDAVPHGHTSRTLHDRMLKMDLGQGERETNRITSTVGLSEFLPILKLLEISSPDKIMFTPKRV